MTHPASSGGLGSIEPATVLVNDAAIRAVAEWPAALAALRAAYAGPLKPEMVPPRIMARGDGFWLRGLCAVSPSRRYMGCKLIAAAPRIHRASYLIALFEQDTMNLAALIDGNQVTGIRTAATAAVAVDLITPQRPLRIGVLGSGYEARGLLEAVLACRSTAGVRVYSPTPASRQRFAAHFMQRVGERIDITAEPQPELALKDADVVLCATRSRDESPVLLGRWLAPGASVVSIGSTLPEQREVDADTFARASLVVADMPEEIAHDTGDAIAARAAGIDVDARLVSLADVATHRVAPRTHAHDIVLYKSVGTALQDVVIAEMLFERARAAGRVTALPGSILTIDK